MFIKRTRVRSGEQTYTYLQLVESVWKEGRPTHSVLLNLGREDQIDGKQIDRLIVALAPYGEGEVLSPEGLRILGAREYGSLLALEAVWDELELGRIISEVAEERRFGFDPVAAVKAMVLSRVLAPGSDKGILRWRDLVYLPEVDGLELQHLYRGLDFLVEAKEYIEARLVQVLTRRLVADLNLVLFDTTSVYFEGDGPEGLAEYGYSRDRRGDRPQVVLGLLTTADGLPLSHVVLPGNTSDVKALREAIRTASERLPVSQVVLVIDRGMVSEANLREMEASGPCYIAGAKYRQLSTREALHRAGRYRRVAPNLLVKEAKGGPRRLIVCHNPEEALHDRQEREAMVSYLERQLAEHGLKGLLKNGVARRYLKVDGDTVQLDRRRIQQDELKDGKWVLVTNSSLPADQVALAYKGLWRVERAFRTLKTPLEIRPIYHWADRRVCGHIAACVLAYLLQGVLERRLEAAGLDLGAAEALGKLAQLRAAEVQLGKRRLLYRTELNPEQQLILEACGAKLPPRLRTA